MSIHVRTNKEFYKNPVSLTQSSIQSPTAGSTSTQRLSHTDTLRAVKDGTLTVDGITLELSDEVRGAIQKASDQAFADNEATGMLNAAIHNANVARQQSESCEKALDNEQKALEIARRISKGGKVPSKDEKLLMDYSPELYQMAKQAAMLAKHHKKYKSLVDDEEDTPKNYDADEGTDPTNYQVQVDVSMGDTPEVEGVSEVATMPNPK